MLLLPAQDEVRQHGQSQGFTDYAEDKAASIIAAQPNYASSLTYYERVVAASPTEDRCGPRV